MVDMTVQSINYIVKTPGTLGGAPRIAGRRIGVHDIVIDHLQLGQSLQQIGSNYELSLAEIHAALSYYYDHQDEIDGIIAEGDRIEAQHKDDDHMAALRKEIEVRAEA